jgi:eukaryotic-like serine/threonine-protein kinase
MSQDSNLDRDISLPPNFGEGDISLNLQNNLSVPVSGEISQLRSGTFMPGDLLANRYRIHSLIADGGMGRVYEAEDLELQQGIAIKTILPGIASDPKALALLKSEVLLSLKVTHPNVCRIFNLDCHRSPSPDVPPVWFVTMELLRGHTLSQEIKKTGKLSTERALPIAQQMANGLEAARRANVVHGDFKSGNVLLVPGAEDTIRAVITDFGLALALEAARNSRTANVGTPAYMAPEQVTGAALSPQTDVYSFGVVLYEMVTGQWPFNADTPERVAAKRLTEAPAPPIRFAPNLDPVWNRVILKCLARESSERYESAVAAVDEITGRSRLRKSVLALTAFLLFVIAGTVGFARYREIGPFRPKPEVAVMGWRNRSGDPMQAWIATELSERLSDVLQQSTTGDVIPQQDVDRARVEFSVPVDKDLEQEDLSQFRTALGANSFVAGSYDVRNGLLILDGVVQNAKGRPLTRFHQEAPLQDLERMVSNVAEAIDRTLDREPTSGRGVASIYPKTSEGRRLYFDALDRLHSFDANDAKEKLLRVVAIEGDSVAAHASLAEAWSQLKYDKKAIQEGEKAVTLARSQELPPELLQATEARYAELQQKWADASQRYKALHDFFPSKLNYSLRYAAALTKEGQPAESIRFLNELTHSPPPIGDDPRIQTERAEAFGAESNYAEELKAAQQSQVYASRRQEKLMQADADLEVCWAQQKIGNPTGALDTCETALSIFSTFDDGVSAAVAFNGIANIKMGQSDYKGAEQAYQHVLGITERANAQVDTAGALLNLAKSEILLGDIAAAETNVRQSIELSQRIEDHGDEGRAHILLGSILENDAKNTEAREQYNVALQIGEQISDRDIQAYALSNLGQLALDDHAWDSAERYLRQALAFRTAIGEPAGIARLQLRLSDLLLSRRQMSEARSLAEKARATSEKLGDMGTFADALCTLAEIDLSSGDSTASLKNSARAAELYHSQQDGDSEAQAYLLSARGFLSKHDMQSASAEVAKAQSLSGVTSATKRDVAKLTEDIRTVK